MISESLLPEEYTDIDFDQELSAESLERKFDVHAYNRSVRQKEKEIKNKLNACKTEGLKMGVLEDLVKQAPEYMQNVMPCFLFDIWPTETKKKGLSNFYDIMVLSFIDLIANAVNEKEIASFLVWCFFDPSEYINPLWEAINSSSVEWKLLNEKACKPLVTQIANRIYCYTGRWHEITEQDIAAVYQDQKDQVLTILHTFADTLYLEYNKVFHAFIAENCRLSDMAWEISEYRSEWPQILKEEARNSFVCEIIDRFFITRDMAESLFDETYHLEKDGWYKKTYKGTTSHHQISEEHLQFIEAVKAMPKPQRDREITEPPKPLKQIEQIIEEHENINRKKALSTQKPKNKNNKNKGNYDDNDDYLYFTPPDNTKTTDTSNTPFGPNGEIIDVEQIGLTLDECAAWKQIIINASDVPMPDKLQHLFMIFKTDTAQILDKNQIETQEQLLSVLKLLFRKDFNFLQD